MKITNKLTALLFVALLVGCVSSAEVNQQAENNYATMVKKAQDSHLIDNSSPTAKRIQNVFRIMVPYADKENQTGQKFNWRLTVVKSQELNAWAMAGGKMMFYTGLVDKLHLTDDEIAVVMGHEMAHALQEHSKSAQNLGTMTTIIGGIADVAASVALGADTGGLFRTGMALGVDMPYSRGNETEADEVGLILMAKAGFNPQAAPNLWKKMQAASGSGGGGLLSTHPSDESRQANLQRLLPEAMKYYKPRKA
ncbi:Zn-dependent protease with chaperone function [Pasteurella langaaensis DSM 22999]|uniref:Zn-dependent protease with chaperone function n=1 Tax=Alitibacter langaaensis DSM 22999 TaxID=1122935 RepID=A0A2U0SM77_9PAST|nr:M48 family metallopeptidase [Pasteurella langaaensis]PVX32433.1 Zn-dependent protease with chaperone function [Pasteurella langaaensis DSM 22999]